MVSAFIIFLQSEDQVLPTAKIFDVVLVSAIFALLFGVVIQPLTDFLWGFLISFFAVLVISSKKLKLPRNKVLDIVSSSIPAALALFYLGRIFQQGMTPISVFAAVWFLGNSLIYLKTSKKNQFPLFYFLLTAAVFSFAHLVFEIFEPQEGVKRIINFAISALILTTSCSMFYKRMSRENFKEGLVMFTSRALEKIRQKLKKQEKALERELASLKKDDPFLAEGREISRESGDDAVEFEGHERITVIRENLKRGLAQVKKALSAIGFGKYGKCEKCGKDIGKRRLRVLPQTTLCFECEREVEEKR